MTNRWRDASCSSKVVLSLDDWVRRIAVDWPRAVVGTSSGDVLLCDLSNGEVLSRVEAHPGQGGGEREMRLLHGDYDGGGPTAVAMAGDCVVSAGRDGDARLWRIVDEKLQQSREAARDMFACTACACCNVAYQTLERRGAVLPDYEPYCRYCMWANVGLICRSCCRLRQECGSQED